ncbi:MULTISPECIES: hypothetical protein [Hymenobacter]|uniref:Uncharacterized protein n=1 Tax=Hymenobacter mucosus TaxID=1411120 RepID=A0A238XNY2_9BACT|nr:MULTISPECIES: hypothetical protein [Hymenobacter]SNR60736.1 hypothetical protein SAMN06269173_104274 [Hymenobacter mucosus]
MNTSEKSAYYLGGLIVIATAVARALHYLDACQTAPMVFGFAILIAGQQQYVKRLKRRNAELEGEALQQQ